MISDKARAKQKTQKTPLSGNLEDFHVVKSLSIPDEIKQCWLSLWPTDECNFICSFAEYYDLGLCGNIPKLNRQTVRGVFYVSQQVLVCPECRWNHRLTPAKVLFISCESQWSVKHEENAASMQRQFKYKYSSKEKENSMLWRTETAEE